VCWRIAVLIRGVDVDHLRGKDASNVFHLAIPGAVHELLERGVLLFFLFLHRSDRS
jgi:hypothetical protein